jgi:cell division protein FtsW (lipid II flippase)
MNIIVDGIGSQSNNAKEWIYFSFDNLNIREKK